MFRLRRFLLYRYLRHIKRKLKAIKMSWILIFFYKQVRTYVRIEIRKRFPDMNECHDGIMNYRWNTAQQSWCVNQCNLTTAIFDSRFSFQFLSHYFVTLLSNARLICLLAYVVPNFQSDRGGGGLIRGGRLPCESITVLLIFESHSAIFGICKLVT